MNEFLKDLVQFLLSVSGYIQNQEECEGLVIFKDRTIIYKNGIGYNSKEYAFETIKQLLGWSDEKKEQGFASLICQYINFPFKKITLEFLSKIPVIDICVDRKGQEDNLWVVFHTDEINVVYHGLECFSTTRLDDYSLFHYVEKFIAQLQANKAIDGSSDIYSIIRSFDVMHTLTRDFPDKNITYKILYSGGFTKLHVFYNDEELLEVFPESSGKVTVSTNGYNRIDMVMREFIALMMDFGPMLDYIKSIKILGAFDKNVVFKNFYIIQELSRILLHFTGNKHIFLGDNGRNPYIMIGNCTIMVDLYTNTVSWYSTESGEPAVWYSKPLHEAFKVLKEDAKLEEVAKLEEAAVFSTDGLERGTYASMEEPHAKEEKEDTQENTCCEDESDQGEKDSREEDDQWDSDDPEEDDDYSDDEDDEEEEETSEDSEDYEDEDDEDTESDYGDDDSEPDDDDVSEESFTLPTPKSLSTTCMMMFGRVLNMFTGQPSTRLAIMDKDDTVIISWPGSPCPVQLTLTGYPKDKQNPEGPWLFEATASFQDRTFSTNPQSLIECVNDYKETLESLTTSSK